MNLLEQIAFDGIRLSTSLVMFRKALFTLDGILHDIGAPEFSIESVIGKHILQNGLTNWKSLGLPLSFGDWMVLQCSAWLFPGRLLLNGAQNVIKKEAQPDAPVQSSSFRKRSPVLRKKLAAQAQHTRPQESENEPVTSMAASPLN
jgi:hypothetical protein